VAAYVGLQVKLYLAFRVSYGAQFGGVVTIRPEMFRNINGFPITYFGWGGEDDDMGNRFFHSRICNSRIALFWSILSN